MRHDIAPGVQRPRAAEPAWGAVTPQTVDAPHSASRRLVLGVVVGSATIVVIAAAAIAFSYVQWPVLPGFTWAYVTLYLVTGLVTAVLLMQATPETWSRSLALLTAGYIYSALATVPFLLSFPGAFRDAPEPLVGGSQSAVWTFYLWAAGFLAFVLASTIAAAGQRAADPSPAGGPGLPRRAPSRAATLLLGVVPALGLAVVVLAGGPWLPDLIGPGLTSQKTMAYHVLSWSVVAFGLLTLGAGVLEARHGSQLRVWLVPVVLLTAFGAVQLASSGRYRVGWYAPRLLGMLATTVLLVALLAQVWRQARALAAARARSDRLAQVVAQSQTGYALLDRDGMVVDVNQALCDLTGYAAAELVGAPADLAFGSRDDPTADIASLLVGDTRSVTLRRRVARRDGSSVWVDLLAHRMVDVWGRAAGVAVSVSDASGDVAADLDPQAPVGTAVVSADGVIIRATQSLATVVGRDRDALLGSRFADLVVPSDRAGDAAAVERMRSGEVEVSGGELRLVHEGREPIWAAVYRSALRDARGSLVGVAVQVIDVDDRKRAETAALEAQRFLEHRSTYDDLTGLLNRATLVDRLQQALDSGSSMAVLVVDLDRFRRVSNSMARSEADAVITEAARRLVETVGEDALVARVGGDEFAIAFPQTAAAHGLDLAHRIRAAVADTPTGPPGDRRLLTCCIGVTVSEPGADAADLLQQADLATREAKESGPGQVRLFDHRMRDGLLSRLAMVDRIRTGLADQQFVAWYQPVVSLSDGRLVGYEALSRWITGDGTIVPPDEYFPVAEDSGLVIPVGACTLDAAVARLAVLPAPLTMAVNASPTELLGGDFAGRVDAALARHGVPPGRLIVEITEQALFDVARAEDAGLVRLADLGVLLHVDDFGTGYSSITHLRDFPVHGIKLDRSFTAELDRDGTRALEISAALADLADRLALDTVGEGVETQAQADCLAALGWRHGQGWLFGRPEPASATDATVPTG